jgi:hypothetical protein
VPKVEVTFSVVLPVDEGFRSWAKDDVKGTAVEVANIAMPTIRDTDDCCLRFV